jgi:hypothetical protein
MDNNKNNVLFIASVILIAAILGLVNTKTKYGEKIFPTSLEMPEKNSEKNLD